MSTSQWIGYIIAMSLAVWCIVVYAWDLWKERQDRQREKFHRGYCEKNCSCQGHDK